MKKESIPAIVLGMTANGLSVTRSLGRKGIKVVGVDFNSNGPGFRSRYCKERFITADPGREPERFLEDLIHLGKKYRFRPVMLITDDKILQVVSPYRNRLKKFFRFNLPSNKLVETFLDKRKAHEEASRLGLECAATYVAGEEKELDALVNRLTYPCVLKPAFSHVWKERFGSKKLVVATDEVKLREQFSELRLLGQEIMIQEMIPGRDDSFFTFLACYDRSGRPLAMFSKRKVRQYPIHYGIGSFHVSENNPQVLKMGDEFCRSLGYRGLIGIEFKEDERDGRLKFMEANLRTVMSGELPIAAGMDLPYLYYRELTGMAPRPVTVFEPDVKIVNFELDLASFWYYKRAGELSFSQWARSFKGKVVDEYFAKDDLAPFLFVLKRFTAGKTGTMVRLLQNSFSLKGQAVGPTV